MQCDSLQRAEAASVTATLKPGAACASGYLSGIWPCRAKPTWSPSALTISCRSQARGGFPDGSQDRAARPSRQVREVHAKAKAAKVDHHPRPDRGRPVAVPQHRQRARPAQRLDQRGSFVPSRRCRVTERLHRNPGLNRRPEVGHDLLRLEHPLALRHEQKPRVADHGQAHARCGDQECFDVAKVGCGGDACPSQPGFVAAGPPRRKKLSSIRTGRTSS